MYKMGGMSFLNEEDLNNRYIQINPKNFLSDELKEILSNIPADKWSEFIINGDKEFEKENYKSAYTFYLKAIEENSQIPRSWFSKGLAEVKLEKFQNAIDSFTRVIERKPDFLPSYKLRANSYLNECTSYDNIKKAIKDYSYIIEKELDIEAYFLIGYCYHLIGRKSEAKENWLIAKKHSLTDTNVENWLNDYS